MSVDTNNDMIEVCAWCLEDLDNCVCPLIDDDGSDGHDVDMNDGYEDEEDHACGEDTCIGH